jgi:RNA polymerase sigma-70 factor, ECF subfamily
MKLRHDLDVSVKPLPRLWCYRSSFPCGWRLRVFFFVENRTDSVIQGGAAPVGYAPASWPKEGKGDPPMTYASMAANSTGRNDAVASVSKPLHFFAGRKRNASSMSCKPGRNESHNLAKTRTEGMGIKAFHEMFVTSRPKFVAMAHAVLRNREDAEDAVQNAFLSGHLHFRSFEGRSALTTWFTRIVLNAALMIQRKRRLSRIRLLRETSISYEANWMERIPASQLDPEMVHAERETLQVVNELLGKMKPALRQAFTLTYHDELSASEACALLGVSAGTFKARLFRARRQLFNQAQRAFVAPARRASASAAFRDKKAFQHLVARFSDTYSPEVSQV